MDTNHPIPQDVTGFQFRLIGDMTVKQFAYIAVGGIFTIVFLYAPIPFLLRIPFMIFFAGLGVALAFMPFEGRPLDVMAGYFVKALFTANQYAYHKKGGAISLFGYQPKQPVIPSLQTAKAAQTKMSTSVDKEKKLQTYLEELHSQHLSPAEKRELEFMQKLFPQKPQEAAHVPVPPSPKLFQREETKSTTEKVVTSPSTQHVQAAPPVSPRPGVATQPPQTQPPISSSPSKATTPEEDNSTLSLQENVLSQELSHAKQEEQDERDAARKQQVHSHVSELEEQLLEIKAQKEQLEQELSLLKAHVSNVQTPKTTPVATPSLEPSAQPQPQPEPPPAQGQQAAVRKIPAEMAKGLGLPHLPDVPNLILGIVKDPRDNVLNNILVEVKDKDGTPARAFRTNQLGQFASATPLSNGTYTIEFEDPKGQHLFDTIEINANGEILMPIEVRSHDEREELRKALFN